MVDSSLLLMSLGVELTAFTQLEFLKSLGLAIFLFEAGLSIGVVKLLRSLNRVLVVELVSYPLLWALAKFAAGALGLGIAKEVVLFLILIDSPSTITISLNKVSSI